MKFPPFNQDAALLRIEGIRKSFRSGWFGSRSSILAVDNVSFEVRYGEVVGLIGGSGSGKTTIARLIMGLERPDTGRVFFDGRELTGMPWGERRRVSCHLHMVFQDPYDAFLNSMRVRDIVAEPLIIHGPMSKGQRQQAVLEALEEVALTPTREFAQRYPTELSGGQRQRVALARALVLRPQLIVADEPTSMLDVSIRAGILDLMRDLKARHGVSYLFSTHDLALAGQFCDRLLVLQRGRVVEQGPAEQVIGLRGHAYPRALIEAVIEPPKDQHHLK